jgi:hypothetical protein
MTIEWGHDLEWGYDINYAHIDTDTTGGSGWLDHTILYPANDWRHAAELFRQSGGGLWLFNEDGEQVKPFADPCGDKVTMRWADSSFVPASLEEVDELYAREEGPDASFK